MIWQSDQELHQRKWYNDVHTVSLDLCFTQNIQLSVSDEFVK